MNRRTGKIARLPETAREFVNESLNNGVSYTTIIHELKKLGHPNFNKQNLQNWKDGGYQEWLQAKERTEFVLKQSKALMLRGKDSDAIATGVTILGISQLWSVLTEFDPTQLKQRLAESPERYFDLILAFNRLLKTRYALLSHVASEHPDPREQKWWSNFMDEMIERSEMYKGISEMRKNRYKNEDEEDEEDQTEENDDASEYENPTPAPSPGDSEVSSTTTPHDP